MVDELRIAITPVIPTEHEGHLIVRLLEDGLYNTIHIRHPEASMRDMITIIEDVPQRWHEALHIHGHFDLVNEYNLGGLHLNRRCPTPPAGYHGVLSASCHNIVEIGRCQDAGLNYVTLSPVFNSISKPGYKGAFSDEDLQALDQFTIKIVALGGVTHDNIQKLKPYNFSGYAMLGGVPLLN